MTSTLTTAPEGTPIAVAMQALVDCRTNECPVPAELLNSVRAWRLASLAEAIERYNARFDRQLLVDAV